MSIPAAIVTLPTAPVPPIAVGFMGLGTGYLIYGTQTPPLYMAALAFTAYGVRGGRHGLEPNTRGRSES